MRAKLLAVLVLASLALPACTNMSREHEHEDREEGNEVKVKMEQVPPAARKTLEEAGRGGTWEDVARISDDGKTIYEGDVKVGDTEYEVRVAEDGTLLSKQAEHDDEKGKDDQEDDK